MLWRVLKYSSLILCLTILIVVGIEAIVFLPRIGTPAGTAEATSFTEAEFISIILAALTAVLAALTIVLTVAAVVGYIAIRESALNAAQQAAREMAREVAEPVASRVAEEVAMRKTGASSTAGDELAATTLAAAIDRQPEPGNTDAAPH